MCQSIFSDFLISYLMLEKFSKHFEIDDPNMTFRFLWISNMIRMRLFFQRMHFFSEFFICIPK